MFLTDMPEVLGAATLPVLAIFVCVAGEGSRNVTEGPPVGAGRMSPSPFCRPLHPQKKDGR